MYIYTHTYVYIYIYTHPYTSINRRKNETFENENERNKKYVDTHATKDKTIKITIDLHINDRTNKSTEMKKH